MARRGTNSRTREAGTVLMLATAGTTMLGGTAAMRAWAQSSGTSSGVSHEIRIVAHVPMTCGISGLSRGVSLTGQDNAGNPIDIPGAAGKFLVECNTPYSLGLQSVFRAQPSPSTGGRSPGELRVDANPAAGAEGATQVAGQSGLPVQTVAETYGVTFRLAGHGQYQESQCLVASAGAAMPVCSATPAGGAGSAEGPGYPRLTGYRGRAGMVITGSLHDPSDPPLTRLEATEAGPVVEVPVVRNVTTAERRPGRGKPLVRQSIPQLDHMSLSLTAKF